MAKRNLIFSLLALILICANAFAAPVGGPLKTVGRGKWGFMLESSNIGERDLVASSTTNASITGVIEERNTFAGKITYGIYDELDIYLKLGGSDLTINTKWPDGSKTKLDYGNAPMFGGGVKYVHTFDNDVLVGGDLQFALQQGSEIEKITEGSINAVITKKGEADLEEFQLSFFCGKKLMLTESITAIPYAGLLFNGVNFSSDQLQYNTWPWFYTITPFELEQDDNVGLFVGGDIDISERVFLSLEARFIAEEAISGSLSYKF